MKKQLKPIYQRRPKTVVSVDTLVKQVSKTTEYNSKDVNIVIREFLNQVEKTLGEKKCVRLTSVGLLYPLIRPSRIGVNMNGGQKNPKKMKVPAMYILKLIPARRIKKSLLKIKITDKQIKNLYL